MKNLHRCATGVIAVGALSVSSHAALLGLDLELAPDITAGLLDVTYDATTDDLSIVGAAITYDDDGIDTPEFITAGVFSLDATVDDTGAASSGALTIGGFVSGDGPMLLLGSLLDFGFSDGGGQILEFVFSVTGGDLAGSFGGLGGEIGVILDMSSGGYSGDWSMDFDNLVSGPGTGLGVSDTGVVPAPSALAILMAAGAGYRRRRRG